MRYLNEVNPNVRILVGRGPELPKGTNQNTRQDKFVEFRFGMADTEDPEAIAVLDARSDCIREEDRGKIKGYVPEADIEARVGAEVERRLKLFTQAVPSVTPDKVERQVATAGKVRKDDARVAELPCPQCKKVVRGRLAYSNHMKTHKKAVAVG